MEDTPTISNAKLPLFGVKMTLKRLAVKLEFVWQGFSDFDSMYRMADARCDRVAIEVRKSHSSLEKVGRRIMIYMWK